MKKVQPSIKEGRVRVNVVVDHDEWSSFKVQCALRNRNLSDLMRELIRKSNEEWFGTQESLPKY